MRCSAGFAYIIGFLFCMGVCFGQSSVQENPAMILAHNYPDIRSAIAACPSSGCIVYASAETVNRNLGTIDPGDKVVTLFLGPYTYTVNQITLRKGLKIVGMGGSDAGTVLQSTNGENPIFVVPQQSGAPATNVWLQGFRLYGSKGNRAEDGFLVDSSTLDSGGLWYSTFFDIYAQDFGGSAFHFRGPSSGHSGTYQFLTFINDAVWRKAGGAPALTIEGGEYQFFFDNCMFEGPAKGDGTNVFIGGGPGPGTAGYPYIINFRGLTSERAATAVQIDGGANIEFEMSHHELLDNAYLVTYGANHARVPTDGLLILNSSFNGNVGVNSGDGYIVKVSSSHATGVIIRNNMIYGTPDHFVQVSNNAQVITQDNNFPQLKSALPSSSGVTVQIPSAATINIGGVHSVGLSPSSTGITTIQGMQGAGESVTFFPTRGSVKFATGGNLELGGLSELKLEAPASASFMRTDLTGSWILVSTSPDSADAGQITISSATSATQPLANYYLSPPLCVVTPTTNPEALKYWVGSTKTELTVNLSAAGNLTFNYFCRRNSR